MNDMPPPTLEWGEISFAAQHELCLCLPDQELVLQPSLNSLHLYQHTRTASTLSYELRPLSQCDGTASHFHLQPADKVVLKPGFPAKALLVNPSGHHVLLAKQHLECYLLLPISVQVWSAEAKSQLLYARSSQYLPDAWFGDENGEACLLLDSPLYENIDSIPHSPHSIVCPLLLANQTDETLPIERFLLNPSYLQLFRTATGQLVCDHVQIRLSGKTTDSLLQLVRPASEQWGRLELLQPASAPLVEQLLKKSFNFLRSMYW